jgi:hypothetical protein
MDRVDVRIEGSCVRGTTLGSGCYESIIAGYVREGEVRIESVNTILWFDRRRKDVSLNGESARDYKIGQTADKKQCDIERRSRVVTARRLTAVVGAGGPGAAFRRGV